MKRIFLTLILALSLGLTACASATPTQAPTTVPTLIPTIALTAAPIVLTDGLNRQVTLPSPAMKIISLAPSNTEILYAVGAGAQVIGRDEFSDYPVEAKALPSVGGSMGKYDLEKIASLKPDLVLAAAINTPEQVKALEDLKLNVYYLANPVDLKGMFENLKIVGKLTGKEQEATTLVDALQGRVQAVTDKLATIADEPMVFYELDGSDAAKPWTAGPGGFVDQLLGMAKGKNAASGLSSSWAQISQEELLVQNPQIILLGDGAYGVTPAQVTSRPGWSSMAAVKDGKIYTFDDNVVSRPGPRLVDGLETMAKLLHPELFK
jgi:iron complex transport system substrate-binding protein